MTSNKCQVITKVLLTVLSVVVLHHCALTRVHASTYYVDNVLGLDSNDGLSTGAAWKTLSKATSIASAGDTVHVVNNGPTNPFHERLAPARSGTSDNHIRFLGYGGSPYILGTIDYSHSVSNGWIWKSSSVAGEYYLTLNNGNPGITQARMLAISTVSEWNTNGVDGLNNRSTGTIGSLNQGQWNWGNNDALDYNTIYYRLATGESDITQLHIEGGEDGAQHRNPILVAWQYIDIENFKVRYSNHHGILNQTLANYVSFNNVDSSYTGRSGISSGTFTNLTVTNSRFDHNGMLSTVRADYTGIQLSGTTNSTIKNNVISNGNNDSGINIKASSNNNVITNNIIFNNAQHGIDISTSSINNTIYNNTMYNNGEQGINVETNSTGNIIKNNIMANNQAYELSVFDIGSTTGLVLNNNIIYKSVGSTNSIRFVGSFYSTDTFATYQSEKSQDANSLAQDPLFSNASGNLNLVSDFKLSKVSPALNAGVSVGVTADYLGTTVPQGALPDIGAYEFLVANSPTSLEQYHSDGVLTLGSGLGTDNTTVIFKFAMESENVTDTLTPEIEIIEQGSSFSNTVTHSGTAYSYSGTQQTAEITVTGLNRGISYRWQARTSNPVGKSSWVEMGGNPDFKINSLVVSSQPESQNSTSISTHSESGNWSCGDPAPVSIPNLFQINVTQNSATIYFTPISNTNKFFISFSSSPNAEQHGTEFEVGRDGVQSYTVNYLQPATKYYFKIRGQNGCMPGDWSRIVSAKTKYAHLYKANYISQLSNIGSSEHKILAPIIEPLIDHEPTAPQLTSPSPVPEQAIPAKKCYFWGLICI